MKNELLQLDMAADEGNCYLPNGMNKATVLTLHHYMVMARQLEERLIKMFKQNQGTFWIGGPGEEAFNVALGMQVKKGQGLAYDFLHLHYRSSAVLLAMGLDPLGPIRQMRNTTLDPYSGGRNFSSHYSVSQWNVVPITSTIETQYLTAIGTGIAQRQFGGQGITIVNGGDAGTAEGDFASCLVWSSRPSNELPILMIVNNNQWGISTAAHTQHGEKNIADRGKAFGIKTMVVNGNDVFESYAAIQEAMDYVRKERKPALLEAHVSRLYGHGSASGANLEADAYDPLANFEEKLQAIGVICKDDIGQLHAHFEQRFRVLAEQVKEEPLPSPDSIHDFTYWQQKGEK